MNSEFNVDFDKPLRELLEFNFDSHESYDGQFSQPIKQKIEIFITTDYLKNVSNLVLLIDIQNILTQYKDLTITNNEKYLNDRILELKQRLTISSVPTPTPAPIPTIPSSIQQTVPYIYKSTIQSRLQNLEENYNLHKDDFDTLDKNSQPYILYKEYINLLHLLNTLDQRGGSKKKISKRKTSKKKTSKRKTSKKKKSSKKKTSKRKTSK